MNPTLVPKHSSLPPQWPRALRRTIAWMLTAKLLALMLLWALFFRGGPL